jgi:hypothetical protein
MDNRLYALKKTLNEIEVCGSENLDRLLGCILTIEKMIAEAEREVREDEQNPNE